MAITLHSAQVVGLDGQPISIEVDISPGLHVFSIVGLADKEVQESRERISAAIKNIGALAPHKKSQRVIVNLAPADIKKEGPAFDLPIALGYLLASGQLTFDPRKTLFLGELGLDGSLRSVRGALSLVLAGRNAGFTRCVLPLGNSAEASLVSGIDLFPAETLTQVIEHLAGRKPIVPAIPVQSQERPVPVTAAINCANIHGQEKAKRALEIAAAGAHNVLFVGPPGVGKTLLARALPGLLPPLSSEEALEVTRIYSIAGLLGASTPLITERPFRSPHHTSSYTAVIGGGTVPRPGEATLAHRGVLFLDEMPEFDRRVIEALRQPLEERSITVARARGAQTFPAQFTLIAAMNPCPCGNFGNQGRDCVCSSGAVEKYKKKLSGPLLDRIDIAIDLPSVTYEKLGEEPGGSSEEIRNRVIAARNRQLERFRGLPIRTNAEMRVPEIKEYIKIDGACESLLKSAYDRYHLSARAYHRLLKLSRTIADLAGSAEITATHISEALQYRPRQQSPNF